MATKTRSKPRRQLSAEPVDSFRMAAIDVGSNSLHMIIAQQDADGSVTTLWRMKEMVGLGRMSFPSKRLSTTAMDAAIASLRRFKDAAQRRQCERIAAVATSAVREAENGGDFVERIRRELQMNVRVISAREEARLIYLGVRHEIEFRSQPHLIVDIGGGSVEFIVGDRQRAMLLESRKLGAARMTARFVDSDPISPENIQALLRHYDRELTPLCESVFALRPVAAIGTSGTLQSIATLCEQYDHKSNGDYERLIRRDTLKKLMSRLLESTSKQLAQLPGLDDQRKDQIIAGVVLTHQIFQKLELEQMRICSSALREGILLDYLTRHSPELSIRRQVPDPRRRSVMDLARRCDWHEQHSLQVTSLCLQLFDQLKELHGLDRTARELIEYGCLLHDIGWHISRDGHHKHSMYLVLHGDLKGFTEEEIRVIANITRYHRKSLPTSAHEDYATLPPTAQRIVSVGASLLRLADGLDRSHASVVSSLRCRIKKQKVEIRVKARADAELEIWGARRKMDFFCDVFDRSLTFEQVD
jgi:exopolyphosphatase / guanosine-5'-triphosphate,3'-diphosphate pyrophosphatase